MYSTSHVLTLLFFFLPLVVYLEGSQGSLLASVEYETCSHLCQRREVQAQSVKNKRDIK